MTSSPLSTEFPFFNYNNGILMTTCRDLVDNNRSTLSATSAFAIATAGANEGPSNKEVFRRMSLANTGMCTFLLMGPSLLHGPVPGVTAKGMGPALPWVFDVHCGGHGESTHTTSGELPALASYPHSLDMKPCFLLFTLLTSPLMETEMGPFFLYQQGSAYQDRQPGQLCV
jgi:hypothetical protein